MGKALIIKGADFSQVAVDTIDIVVGQPTISIDLFGNVTITSPNGEDIYYTTDGSTPTTASTKYTAGFSVQMNTTVKAVCYLGGKYSEVVSLPYNGTLQAPVIDIAPNGVVTISATNNASINYTVNGADPTNATGTLYSESFKVNDGDIVKAIAYITNGSDTITSSVSSLRAVVYEWLYGKGIKVVGSTRTIDDIEGSVLSPKLPIDITQPVLFYFKATGAPNILAEFDENDNITSIWNAQSTSPRTVSAAQLNAGTQYVRFSCSVGQSYEGTGVKATHNGETVELYYDGSPAPSE